MKPKYKYDSKEIGNRLKKLRNEKGMTQLELCLKCNIASPSTISDYENDRKDVPLEIIFEYANIFQVSVEYICVGHESDTKMDIEKAINNLTATSEHFSKSISEINYLILQIKHLN